MEWFTDVAHKWENLKKKMSPDQRARIDASVDELLATMPLAELRKAIGMTQVELAQSMQLGQGSVSKIENSTDLYLSTLRRFIESLGGNLVIKAEFPDGREMEIGQFSDALDDEMREQSEQSATRRRRSA